jgi:hypothetical protein
VYPTKKTNQELQIKELNKKLKSGLDKINDYKKKMNMNVRHFHKKDKIKKKHHHRFEKLFIKIHNSSTITLGGSSRPHTHTKLVSSIINKD